MPYVTQADLAELPDDFLIEALDDDNDGAADSGAWDLVAAQAGEAVDAYLGARYEVPLESPYPPLAKQAAKVFALEILYERRGQTGDKNPAKTRAEEYRRLLRDIAQGKVPLAPELNREKPSAAAITAAAQTMSATNSFLAI